MRRRIHTRRRSGISYSSSISKVEGLVIVPDRGGDDTDGGTAQAS